MASRLLTLLFLSAAVAAAHEQAPKRRLQLFGGSRPAELPRPASLWAEQADPDGAAAHKTMSAWLQAFFSATPAEDLTPPPPDHPRTHRRGGAHLLPVAFREKESSRDPHRWVRWENDTASCADIAARGPPPRRRFLIVSPVGSSFNASKWMSHPKCATYDIIALYYGSPTANFSCPLCRAVVPMAGPKWGLLNRFLRQNATFWASELAPKYEAIMVPDDDLEFADTCALNRLFEVFSSYRLLLAQPAVCRTPHRATYWDYLYRRPDTILRYVSFVEIMAPIFRSDFFAGVVAPSLWDAYTGWGLDFTWPFLLRYPRRHIGVIDEVCVRHSNPVGQSRGEGNLYALPLPYDEREEESRRAAQYGYYASRVEAMGMPYRGMIETGAVERSVRRAEEAALLAAVAAEEESGVPMTAASVPELKRRRQLHSAAAWVLGTLAAMGAAGAAVAVTTLRRRRGRSPRTGRRSPKHAMAAVP